MYEGQNRNRGASYSFFVRSKEKTDTSSKTKTDSATVRIYNLKNELIRTLKVKADSGFNRAYWGFEMKGIRQPGAPRARGGGGGAEPGGMPVYPGTYKLVMNIAKDSDSTFVVVNNDPAAPLSKEIYDAKMVMIKRLEKSTIRLTAITDRFTDADDIIAKIDAELKNVEGKEADSLRKAGKTMTDSMKTIRNFIFGKPQEKQGYGSPYQLTVNGKLGEARNEVMGKTKIPDAQELRLAEEAESLVNEAVQKANAFFSGPWVQYQQLAESTPRKIFKEFKVIE